MSAKSGVFYDQQYLNLPIETVIAYHLYNNINTNFPWLKYPAFVISVHGTFFNSIDNLETNIQLVSQCLF